MTTQTRNYREEALAFLLAQDETYSRLVSEIDELRAEVAAATVGRDHWQARAKHYREQLIWLAAITGVAVLVALLDLWATAQLLRR